LLFFFLRYLKSNQSKFYGTLNETRFGLKADVNRLFFYAKYLLNLRFQGPAAVIAMKVLGESDEYQCAFLRSPVNDLSHYCQLSFIDVLLSECFLSSDATYSERIHGLKINPKSVRTSENTKQITFLCLSVISNQFWE